MPGACVFWWRDGAAESVCAVPAAEDAAAEGMNRGMNTVDHSPNANAADTHFSRVVTRHADSGAERIEVHVSPRADHTRVALVNHWRIADGAAPRDTVLTFRLPAGGDGVAYANAFIDAYAAPVTLESLLEGYAHATMVEYEAEYTPDDEPAALALFGLADEPPPPAINANGGEA